MGEGRTTLSGTVRSSDGGFMGIYRASWGTLVVLATLLALYAGGPEVGWDALILACAMTALTGATFALAWAEPRRLRRTVCAAAFWSTLGAVLAVGLPQVFGAWALVPLLGLGATAPPVVRRARDLRRRTWGVWPTDHPERLADRDLQERWRRTGQELRSPTTRPTAALRLVQERELLLDEIERRDPAGFAATLVRAGWRGADSAADL